VALITFLMAMLALPARAAIAGASVTGTGRYGRLSSAESRDQRSYVAHSTSGS
jgi:hypothetical protein